MTRQRFAARGLDAGIARRELPAPIAVRNRWGVERSTIATYINKKVVWYTERRAAVVAIRIVFSLVLIIVGRLPRERWVRYQWDADPQRRP